MVPHHRILRAATLAALADADPAGALADIGERLAFCPPPSVATVDALYAAVVQPYLPRDLDVRLRTTDALLTGDTRPLLQAASYLEVSDAVALTPEFTVMLQDPLPRWREDPTLRVFLETCLLAKLPTAIIADDLQRMWGFTETEPLITTFAHYFLDLDFTTGTAWLDYARCIGQAEADFKQTMRLLPADCLRWKLGAPVCLDTEKVLDRMISDGYFTERVMKQEAGGAASALSKDQLARVKLERETIFKALDRKLKLKDSKSGGTDFAAAHETLKKITIEYNESPTFPSLSDLRDGDAPE